MENQTIQNNDSEEIDLRQMVEVLLKRKKIIILFTVIAALAALLVSLVMPKVYKTSLALEIGTISKDGSSFQLIEETKQVVGKINNDVYGSAIRQKLGISQNDYPKITAIDATDTNIITLFAESSNPDIAKKVLDEINDQIISSQQPAFDAAKKNLEDNITIENNNINRLSKEIELLNVEISAYQKQINFFENSGSSDIGSQFMVLNLNNALQQDRQEIENLNLAINDSSRRISSLQSSLAMIKPTTVIKPSIVSEKPVSPKIMLNVIIGAILGLFVGIFAAFAADWWKQGK